MKAKLIYTLPEEDDLFKRAVKSDKLCETLWDYSQYLRSQLKYSENPDTLDKARDKFHELMRDNDINLDELWR